MHPRLRTAPLAFLTLLLFTGCASDSGEEAAPSDTGAASQAAPEAAPGPAAGEVSPEDQEAILQTGLLGEWRWVGYQGMDDSTLEVDDPSKYTLTFRVDGVQAQVDCNRANGSFDLDGSSLTFGPLAMTRMACPPESLGDRYAAYLNAVRSYVIEDGHLFLSLMADGGILEFAPGSGPA